jgi:microcystin-dependent protein
MEPYIGQIQAFGFNFAPLGWAQCNGQLLPIAEYDALFSLLGTTYGGDGQTTFALPDLRGRSIVHPGQGPGLSPVQLGQNDGQETVTLTINQLPSHNHAVSVAVNTGNGEESASTKYIASHASAFNEAPSSGAFLAGVNQTNAGGNQPINIRNPYLGIYYCIALEGIYPSRN